MELDEKIDLKGVWVYFGVGRTTRGVRDRSETSSGHKTNLTVGVREVVRMNEEIPSQPLGGKTSCRLEGYRRRPEET